MNNGIRFGKWECLNCGGIITSQNVFMRCPCCNSKCDKIKKIKEEIKYE